MPSSTSTSCCTAPPPTARPGPRRAGRSRASRGESVVIIDEGLAFNPERGTDRVLLVADETGLPAIAGICASLPADAIGPRDHRGARAPMTRSSSTTRPASRCAGSCATTTTSPASRRSSALQRARREPSCRPTRSTRTSSASRRCRPSARRHLVAERGVARTASASAATGASARHRPPRSRSSPAREVHAEPRLDRRTCSRAPRSAWPAASLLWGRLRRASRRSTGGLAVVPFVSVATRRHCGCCPAVRRAAAARERPSRACSSG